ncbi:sensor histidine kinase [Paraflavitalea sp. CAU 1676]|uniref:sensor histidine kinase n=1 Tax=Paraflavitalea sp. CAU 1676 TaxID=3032598 RepID=UPI0023DCDFD9|nr:sensor histidine kinase [Paraflavitalea sp. CAU 1676]MDF2187470.1 sensor histidine kinase [Paraflavitalea sp. CAU 1676]
MLFSLCLSTAAQSPAFRQDSLRQILAAIPNDTNKVAVLNELAIDFIQTNLDSCIHYANLANDLAHRINYEPGEAHASMSLANARRTKGAYTASLYLMHRAIAIYEKHGMLASQADALLYIAQVYKDMSGHNLTDEYLLKGIGYSLQGKELFQSIGDPAGVINSLNMLGIIYRDMGKRADRRHYYDTAFRAFTEALQLVNSTGKGKDQIGKLYNNISQVYLEYKKDYPLALDYLFKAVAFNTQNNNLTSLTHNYGNISNAYLKLNDHQQALLYGRKMLTTALRVNKPERLFNAYRQLHESFRVAGRTDSALHYYVLADKLEDSLNNITKTNEVVELQTRYETAQKESQIQQLQTESDNQHKRIALLASVIVLFALLTTSLLWLYRRVRRQRQQIADQSKHLEVMMKELHHRVKNNLQIVSSLLSLQTYKVQDEGVVFVLRESQQRVQAMSFIHQRLYKKDDLTSVNMKEYLTDLAESLITAYGFHRDQFDLQVKIEREMMDIDKALPVGLIINEMITNALKYAYPDCPYPALHIVFAEEPDKINIIVRDNGIGINEAAWKQKNNSFGKQLITALCKQMRAQQQLVIDRGTQFIITLPRQAA